MVKLSLVLLIGVLGSCSAFSEERLLQHHDLQDENQVTVDSPHPGSLVRTGNIAVTLRHSGKDEDERVGRKFRLYFGVNEELPNRRIKEAELRLSNLEAGKLVFVHDIVRPGRKNSGHGPILRLVDTRIVGKDGTATADVKPAVERWGVGANHGLLVEVERAVRVRRGDHRLVLHLDDDEQTPESDPHFGDSSDVGCQILRMAAPTGHDSFFCPGDFVPSQWSTVYMQQNTHSSRY